jgi:hypothetical protein
MPRVIVTTDSERDQPQRTLLDEYVDPVHLESRHSADAFVERLGWAIVDASGPDRRDGPDPGGPPRPR